MKEVTAHLMRKVVELLGITRWKIHGLLLSHWWLCACVDSLVEGLKVIKRNVYVLVKAGSIHGVQHVSTEVTRGVWGLFFPLVFRFRQTVLWLLVCDLIPLPDLASSLPLCTLVQVVLMRCEAILKCFGEWVSQNFCTVGQRLCSFYLYLYTETPIFFIFSLQKQKVTQHNHVEEAADHLVKFLQTSPCNTVQF